MWKYHKHFFDDIFTVSYQKKKKLQIYHFNFCLQIRRNYVYLVHHHYYDLCAIDCLSHSVPMAVVCCP